METGCNTSGHKFKVGDAIDWNLDLYGKLISPTLNQRGTLLNTYGIIVGVPVNTGVVVKIKPVCKVSHTRGVPRYYHIDWCLPRLVNTVNVKVDYLGNFLDNELSNEDKLIIKKYLLYVSK